jgi:hypothetical protein
MGWKPVPGNPNRLAIERGRPGREKDLIFRGIIEDTEPAESKQTMRNHEFTLIGCDTARGFSVAGSEYFIGGVDYPLKEPKGDRYRCQCRWCSEDVIIGDWFEARHRCSRKNFEIVFNRRVSKTIILKGTRPDSDERLARRIKQKLQGMKFGT